MNECPIILVCVNYSQMNVQIQTFWKKSRKILVNEYIHQEINYNNPF